MTFLYLIFGVIHIIVTLFMFMMNKKTREWMPYQIFVACLLLYAAMDLSSFPQDHRNCTCKCAQQHPSLPLSGEELKK